MTRYRLKLSRLDFVSLVDDPAQPNAKTLLIKRKGDEVEGETHAKFVKASDELGLAFFWAFTSTNPDGSEHYDLHGDTVDQDFVKAAMDFMLDGGGAVDEMHDGEARSDARVAFAFPMTPDIAKAFQIETKTAGLMVAVKLNPEQLAKLKDGTYTGVSIAGLGTREPLEKSIAAQLTDALKTLSADERTALIASLTPPTQSKSTRREPAATVATPTKETTMDSEKEIADLKARIAELEAQLAEKTTDAEMDDEEKALAASLAPTEQKRFRSLAKSARLAEVAKAKEADPILAVVDGTVYRKSTPGSQLAVKIAAQEAEIEKAKFAKEAADLFKNKAPGTADAHQDIVRALRKSGLPADRIAAAEAVIAGLVAVSPIGKAAPGGNGGDLPTENPGAEYEELLVKAMADNKCERPTAAALVLKTARGQELYAQISKLNKTRK